MRWAMMKAAGGGDLPYLLLDNFNEALLTNLLSHTPDIGQPWVINTGNKQSVFAGTSRAGASSLATFSDYAANGSYVVQGFELKLSDILGPSSTQKAHVGLVQNTGQWFSNKGITVQVTDTAVKVWQQTATVGTFTRTATSSIFFDISIMSSGGMDLSVKISDVNGEDEASYMLGSAFTVYMSSGLMYVDILPSASGSLSYGTLELIPSDGSSWQL